MSILMKWMSCMKTHEAYLRELEEKNPNVECLGTYSRSTDKTLHRCKVCGHEWMVKPYTLVSSKRSGCPHCAAVKAGKANQSYTTETFVAALKEAHDDILLIGDYSGSHVKTKFKCTRCDHEWDAMPYSVLQDHGCPRCAKSGTSFMEQVFLEAVKVAICPSPVISRDKSAIGEELDIYLPKQALAFEPGSWPLHKRRLWKDKQKRQLCEEAGIRLVFVYDKYPEGKSCPFADDCFVFHGDFNKNDHEHLWHMVSALLELAGRPREFTEIEKSEIETKAYANSKSITHEVFIERMARQHPTIEVIGRYKNANIRIKCRCTICGWEWDAMPSGLMSGDGCRKCGAKARGKASRLPVDEFIDRLERVDPTIEIDPDSYHGTHMPVNAHCLKCGKSWKPIARTLIRANPCGCSECRKQLRLQKFDDEYRRQLQRDKPYITCLEAYVTRSSKLAHKCEICGHVWRTTPATVLRSIHGCPNWKAHRSNN